MKNKFIEFLKKYWIILFLLLMTAIYFKFIFLGTTLLWDEPVYLGNARSHIGVSKFTEDFRFPLLEYFIASVWTVFGESVISAQILMIMFSILTIFVFYLISKQFFKEKSYVIISTILFGLSSTLTYWSFRIYSDIPSLCFMLWAIYFFLRFLDEKRNYQIFLSGIFTSLSFLMRFSAVLFSFLIIGYLIYDFFKTKKIMNPLFYGLGNLLVLSPWIIYNYITYKNPLWDLFAQGFAIAEYTSWQSPLLYIKDIYSELGFAVILLIFYVIYIIKSKKEFKDYFLISIIILTMLFYLFIVRLKLARYVLMISPFLFLTVVIGLKHIFTKLKKHKSIQILIIILLLINSLIIFNSQMNLMNQKAICEKDGAFQQSITYAQNIPETEVIVSNSWPWYGYYGNHKVFSLWSNNITMFVEKYNVSRFIITKYGGLKYNPNTFSKLTLEKSFKDNCNQEVFIYS